AAGSLDLAMHANAQSPYSPLNARTPAVRRIEPAGPWREEQRNRDVEIKTELAWLDNPSTFPYRLQARVTGSSLEVTGAVPTATLHVEAVRIARGECRLPIKDEIIARADAVLPPATKPAQEISRAVNDALADALP